MLAQTEAVIRSTGGAAKISADQVASMSEELGKLTGTDDELIQRGANMLLTFKSVRNEVGASNDIFNQGTKAALDLSVAFGKDMAGSAVLVGKALDDPIAGVTALRRVGVALTDQQKEAIKTFEETGHHLEAQKVILEELNSQVGGSAEAFGKTLPGQMAIAQEAMKNAQGAIVGGAAPAMELMANVTTVAAEAVMGLPAPLQAVVGGLGLTAYAVIGIATPLKSAIDLFGKLTAGRGVAAAAATTEAAAESAAAATTATSMSLRARSFGAMSLATTGLLGPAGLAAAGLGALLMVTGSLGGEQDKTAANTRTLTDALRDQGVSGFERVNEKIAEVLTTSSTFPAVFKDANANLTPFIDSIRRGGEEYHVLARAGVSHREGMADFIAQMQSGALESNAFNDELLRLATSGELTAAEWGQLMTVIQMGTTAFSGATDEAKLLEYAQESAATSTSNLTGELELNEDQLAAAAKATEGFAGFLDQLAGSYDRTYSATLAPMRANIDYQESLDSLAETLVKNGDTLDANTEKGRENLEAALGAGEAIVNLMQQRFQETHSVQEATNAGLLYVEGLRGQMREAGFSEEAIANMIATMHLTPEEIATQFDNNAVEQQLVVGKYLQLLTEIPASKRSEIEALIMQDKLDEAYALLNKLTEPRTAEVRIRQIFIPGQANYERWGGVVHAFAGGGFESYVARSQTVKFAEPETGGEAYIPRLGAPNRAMNVLREAAGWYGAAVVPRGMMEELARMSGGGGAIGPIVIHVDGTGLTMGAARQLGNTIGAAVVDRVTPLAARRMTSGART